MAKLAGKISGTSKLHDPRAAANNSQDPVHGIRGLPRKVNGPKETRCQEEPTIVTPRGSPLHIS